MRRQKPSSEAETKYQADVALAARRSGLLRVAREAESRIRQAQARRAPQAEIRRLAEDLDAALTAAMQAAYAAQRAEIGPRGYDDRIYHRKAKAKPGVHALTAEAEHLLTLRETHRLSGIPAVEFKPGPLTSSLAITEARMSGDPLSQAQDMSVAPEAGKAAGADRYKENPFRQLIPAWYYPKVLEEQDASYFEKYNDDIFALVGSARTPDKYGPAVLAASQRIYDDGLSRRESINTRCGAVLSTGGILGALFVAAGQLGLMQQKGSYGIAAWLVLSAFLAALAYVGFAIVMALAVQASLRGNVLDPSDIAVGIGELNPNEYNVYLAKKNLLYTVKNYEVSNLLMFRLQSAQRCLRNGIVAIIFAGMLSPLALHTAKTSGSSTLPTGGSAGRLTISAGVQGISSQGSATCALPISCNCRV
jgi:hypothetical protein